MNTWFVYEIEQNCATQDLPDATTLEDRMKAALNPVKGWSWDLERVVLNTPPQNISRSKCSDR